MSSSSQLIRTIRLEDEKLNELIGKLDELAPNDSPEGKQRNHVRYSFRAHGCVIHMQQPGAAGTTAYQVVTRNISAQGMAFLHGGYVHTGTECFVQLVSTHGAWIDVKARVVRCTFAQGNIHDVGVLFDDEIEPGDFCPDAITTRVLLVEDEPTLAKLTLLYLQRLNAEADHAENGQIAVEMTSKQVYDVVLMDMEMPVMGGLDATRKMRENGYCAPIVALTALTRPEDREKSLQAGCNSHLNKPTTQEALAEALDSSKTEPLMSMFRGDEAMKPLIDEFVQSIPTTLRKIEEAVAADDASQIESITRSLKGEGKSFGFDPISELAAKVESGIQAGNDLNALKGKISELNEMCVLARASH